MKKRFGILFSIFCMAFSLFAERGNVTIVYTNDVHTYIANDGGLSYGSVKAIVDDLKAEGKNVILADAGDHVQGTAYGAMDNGKTIIELMNATGYNVATLGNHEFDYGADRVFEIMAESNFPYVSCNFLKVKNKKTVTDAFKVFQFGRTKVAFVGVTTPETYTKSTPAYFMDKDMTQFIYKISAGDDGKELYSAVQKAVNDAKKKADYVIVLGHLGDDPTSSPWTSEEVIANTYGFDAFIDGHSHSTVEQKIVKNSKGQDVVLTQTGSYLNNVGIMTLSSSGITAQLVSSYDRVDETVEAMVQAWKTTVDESLNEVIAIADTPLYINTASEPKTRLIRKQETNLGDLVADAAYWYMNEVEGLNCDITIGNGGGIRVDLPAGEYSYNSAKKVQPFGNVMCMVQLSGQEVLDALEFGARSVGTGECGGFLQVAGCRYTIDTSVESTIQISTEGLWLMGPAEYRVCDVEVYNRETKQYEPLDLNRIYTMGGVNYTLRQMGDGFSMLAATVLVKDYMGEDYLMTSAYVKAFGGVDANGLPHISTANSPLSSYENYLLDYENPEGSGRITIK